MDNLFGRHGAELMNHSNDDIFDAFEPAGLEPQSAQLLTHFWEPR